MNQWVIYVTGVKPESGHPPWARFKRLPGELSEAEIEEVLRGMAPEHTAVRAVRGGVEIEIRRRYSVTKRVVGAEAPGEIG